MLIRFTYKNGTLRKILHKFLIKLEQYIIMQKNQEIQKKFILGLCVCILSLVFFSCKKKCEQNQIVDLKFTQNDLIINPYSGDEVLIFKNLAGDSLTFNNGRRYNDRYTEYQIGYEEAKLYNSGCQGDFFNADKNVTIFWRIPHDSETNLSITLYFLYSFKNPTLKTSINLFFFHGRDITGFDATFEFRKDSLFNFPGKPDSIVAYHDQIMIGTKTFYRVYELSCQNGDLRNLEWFKIAYYSITEGYLGFLSNLGQLWYLDRKKK